MALLTGEIPTAAEITELLRSHNISATLQRIRIAQIMFANPVHFCADEVMEKVNEERSMVSKATIYNSLRLFASKGLVRELFADPIKVYYEPKTTDHPHFYDATKGELTDIAPDAISVNGLPTPPNGGSVVGLDLIIRVAHA